MSKLTGQTGRRKTNPRPYIAAAAGVILILYLNIITRHSMVTEPPPAPQGSVMEKPARIPDPNVDPAAAAAYITTLARRYGDRFDQLTPEDRIFLNSIAMGHGRDLLRREAKKVQGAKAP